MKRKQRILSLVLVLCMALSLLPVSAFAAEGRHPFTDVAEGDWFNEAVQFVYENNMMSGTGGKTFSPNAVTSRGMIVTILHRMEGEPTGFDGSFRDVADGAYYANAVAWASANGIVKGYGEGRFGPDDPITREQMAVILYNFASYQGYSLAATGSVTDFSDGGKVSAYAVEAMNWALGAELMRGVGDNRLDPQGRATRAQTATILMNFRRATELYEQVKTIFVKKTTDFPNQPVENLDEDKSSNFVVYQEEVQQMPENSGELRPTDEEFVYVFEHAGDDLKGLSEGDVFVFPDGEGVAKVSEIIVEGDTVTVKGDPDITMADVYEYIDINMDMDVSTVAFDKSALEDGTELYYGDVETSDANARTAPDVLQTAYSTAPETRYAVSGGGGGSVSPGIVIAQRISVGADNAGGGYGGKVEADFREVIHTVHVQYRYSLEEACFYASASMDCTTYVDITAAVEGVAFRKEWTLPGMKLPVFGIITLNLDPVITVDVRGGLKGGQHVVMDSTIGFETGVINGMPAARGIYSQGERTSSWNLELQGSLTGMVDFRVGLGIPFIANAYGQIGAGLELTGKSTLLDSKPSSGDSIHDCKLCIDGDINFVGRVGVGMDAKLLEGLYQSQPQVDLYRGTIKLKDFYVSYRVGGDGSNLVDAGFGKCPHRRWRTDIMVVDADGKAVPNALVEIVYSDGRTDSGRTNGQGSAVSYLPNGNNALKTTVSGKTATSNAVISNAPAFAKLVLPDRRKTVYVVGSSRYDVPRESVGFTTEPDDEFSRCRSIRDLIESSYDAVWIPRSEYIGLYTLDAEPGDILLELTVEPGYSNAIVTYYNGGEYGQNRWENKSLEYTWLWARVSVIGQGELGPQSTTVHDMLVTFHQGSATHDYLGDDKDYWEAPYYYTSPCYIDGSDTYRYNLGLDSNYAATAFTQLAGEYKNTFTDFSLNYDTPMLAWQSAIEIRNTLTNYLATHIFPTIDMIQADDWSSEVPDYLQGGDLYIS